MGARAILANALQLSPTATTDQIAEALVDRWFPEPRRPSLSDMVGALSTAMATVPASETPGEAFHRLAELRARAEGISLVDAYTRQSASTPELWADVRDDQPRGH